MDAGILNKPMTLYRPVVKSDGQGGFGKKRWEKAYTIWGNLKVPRAATKDVQAAYSSELVYEVIVRRLPEEVTGWRLNCQEKDYEVVHDFDGYEYVTVMHVRRVKKRG